MSKFDKDLWRLAETLRGQLVGRCPADGMAPPAEDWRLIEKLVRQIRLARTRGWHLAADRLVSELASVAAELRQRLLDFSDGLRNTAEVQPVASVTEIYRDLISLQVDFDDTCVDRDEDELCVTTTPVTLDSLHLGPFQIRLCWTNLNRPVPYRVVALQPYPARTNDQVTHPHVSDEILCEGEGRTAIRAALQSGRMADLFLLVSQVLHTYAVGSAYVELSDWHGNPCTQCGAGVDDDDRCYCQHCDDMICGDCSCCCAGCDETSCTGCLTACATCDCRFCRHCLDPCTVCHADVCENCSREGRCPDCPKEPIHDDPTIQVDQAIEVSDLPVANAALQPDSLGETPLST